jgi:hypothetical protein
MATYLQGITDYIPEIQPFQPDLNLLQSVVQTKQAQYQAGYDKLSNVYGKLLNSELSREDNIQNRDQYFTQIKNDIDKIASMDLSRVENVNTAYDVFKPILQDKYLQRDMVFTKGFNTEMGISGYFKNCMDEKECGGKWWETGDTAMMYQKDEFMKASKDETLSMGNVEYVPYVNAFKTAYDSAVAMKDTLKMKTVSKSPDGKYQITTTNGMQLVPSLSIYMSQAVGADPKVQKMFETQAYVDRKNYTMSKAAELGSEEAAERQYITDLLTAEAKSNEERQKQLAQDQKTLENDKALVEENAKNHGVAEGADTNPIDLIMGIQSQSDIVAGAKQKQDQLAGLLDPTTNSVSDIKTLRRKADMIRANNLNTDTMVLAAQTYATNTMEEEVKLDEEWKMNYEHQLRLKEMDYKQSLENAAAKKEEATLAESLGLNDGIVSGSLTPEETLNAATEILKEQATAEGNTVSASDAMIKQVFDALNNNILQNPKSSEAQKAKAKQFIEKNLGIVETEEYDASGSSWDQVWWEDWNELSPEQKAEYGNNPDWFASGKKPGAGILEGLAEGFTAVGRYAANFGEAVVEKFQADDKYTRVKKNGYVLKNADGSYSFNGGGATTDPNNAAANVRNQELQKFKTDPKDNKNYRKATKSIIDAVNSEDAKQLFYGSGYDQFNAALNQRYTDVQNAMDIQDDVNEAYKHNDKTVLSYLQANGNFWAGQALDKNGYMMDKQTFINEYVRKQKEWNNTRDYPSSVAGARGENFEVSDKSRVNRMQSDAADIYDDLKDAMWDTFKEGKANQNLRLATKPMGGSTMKGYQGIMYNADIAGGADAFSNKLAADFYAKDLRRLFGDRGEVNGTIMYGDGKDMDELVHDEAAQKAVSEIFSDFLSASPKKSQGKDDRPRFSMQTYYTSKFGDDKVTVVITPSQYYSKEHAGTAKEKGVTAGAFGAAGKPITIVMDKNKAQGLMFEQHKTTALEYKMNLRGQIDRNYGNSGNATIKQDKDGYYSIQSTAKVYNNGKYEEVSLMDIDPMFAPGALGPTTDLNQLVKMLDDVFVNRIAAYNQANIQANRKK